MVGPQNTLAIGQNLLEQWDGLVEPARRLIGDGEVVARGQDIGMVWFQNAFAVFQGPLG